MSVPNLSFRTPSWFSRLTKAFRPATFQFANSVLPVVLQNVAWGTMSRLPHSRLACLNPSWGSVAGENGLMFVQPDPGYFAIVHCIMGASGSVVRWNHPDVSASITAAASPTVLWQDDQFSGRDAGATILDGTIATASLAGDNFSLPVASVTPANLGSAIVPPGYPWCVVREGTSWVMNDGSAANASERFVIVEICVA